MINLLEEAVARYERNQSPMTKEMTETFEDVIASEEGFVRLLAENMALLCGASAAEAFIPQAKQLLKLFKEAKDRLPADYAEIRAWAGYVNWEPSTPRNDRGSR
jgi:hypothetical protein